jgi:predicted transposase YbfD/YdcC
MKNSNSRFQRYFGIIRDVRQEKKVRHKLIDILFIAVIGTIARTEDWEDIAAFAAVKEDWFRKFLELPNGIPSHDTIERVFKWINPKEFQACFINWMKEIVELSAGTIVAIDGKTMRGAFDGEDKKSPIHIVSAWASQNGVVLGQVKTSEKSNEITAIPELLELLAIKDCIVTIDAMGCQKDIAEKIIKKKADYVLALKGNQGNFHKDVVEFFEDAEKDNFNNVDHKFHRTFDKGHGRNEIRKYYLVEDITWLPMNKEWKGLKSIGMAIRECERKGVKTIERRYFISSLNCSAKKFAEAVRKHWGIESMHWSLDVTFSEDKSRVRKDFGPENLAMLKRIALNMLKKVQSVKKTSLKLKRFQALISESYLEQVINENIK